MMEAERRQKRFRRKSLKYIVLSLVLVVLLLISTGCAALLTGDNRKAYDLCYAAGTKSLMIRSSSSFDPPASRYGFCSRSLHISVAMVWLQNRTQEASPTIRDVMNLPVFVQHLLIRLSRPSSIPVLPKMPEYAQEMISMIAISIMEISPPPSRMADSPSPLGW